MLNMLNMMQIRSFWLRKVILNKRNEMPDTEQMTTITASTGPIINCRQIAIIITAVIVVFQTSLLDACLTSSSHKMIQSTYGSLRKSINKHQDVSSNAEKFSQFLLQRYNWEMTEEDVYLLAEAYNEFYKLFNTESLTLHPPVPVKSSDKTTRDEHSLFETFSSPCQQSTADDLRNKDRILPSLSTVQKLINSRKDTTVIGSASMTSKSRTINKKNRLFSKYEARFAWNATARFTNSKSKPCTPRGATFCMDKYFSMESNNNDDLIHFYPPSLFLQRCSQDHCHCLQPDHECLPTNTSHREHYVLGLDREYIPWTWAFYFVDHTSCQCKPRCLNRQCVAPFQIHISNNPNELQSCRCKCPVDKEIECENILSGRKKFTLHDYECITSGRCIKPECWFGNLSEENLYNRQCNKYNKQKR